MIPLARRNNLFDYLKRWLASKEVVMKWLRSIILGLVLATGLAAPLAVPPPLAAQVRAYTWYDIYWWNPQRNEWVWCYGTFNRGDVDWAVAAIKSQGYNPTWRARVVYFQ